MMKRLVLIIAVWFIVASWMHNGSAKGSYIRRIRSYMRSEAGIANSYLKFHVDGSSFRLSFDGNRSDSNTKFVFSNEDVRCGVLSHKIKLSGYQKYALGNTDSRLEVKTDPALFRTSSICHQDSSLPQGAYLKRIQLADSPPGFEALYLKANIIGEASFTDCVDDRGTWLVWER